MAISPRKIEGEEAVHYVSQRKKRGKAKGSMQPPLTPMIDVTFQLLLFFLLTCEFREAEGQIPGSLPAGTQKQDVSMQLIDPIEVHIRPSVNNAELVNYELNPGGVAVITSPAELFVQLVARQKALNTTDVPLVIYPAQDVSWQFVVEAFNQAVRAKFTKIAFARQTL